MTEMAHPKLSIVFLNYNRLEETRFTVNHLAALVRGREDIEVIAIDNGSSDGTPIFLKQHEGWMRLLLLGGNSGIGGLNEGFFLARGDYIMVLDDDSHPVDAGTLDHLIDILDHHPHIGVVACRIESPEGRPVRTWHLPEADVAGPSTCFVGCGFAIRRDLFNRIGWFPGEFFLYQNEMETAIRVMKAGFDIYYEPACRVVHRESGMGRSSWRRVYFPTRNTLWIIRRYFPLSQSIVMIISRLAFGLIRAAQSRQIRFYLEAVRDGFGVKIPRETLTIATCRRLNRFKENNNLFYHLKDALRVK
ncbi:MAG: glycosyltransferase family 2 protein [Pseudomonadota bacterium]